MAKRKKKKRKIIRPVPPRKRKRAIAPKKRKPVSKKKKPAVKKKQRTYTKKNRKKVVKRAKVRRVKKRKPISLEFDREVFQNGSEHDIYDIPLDQIQAGLLLRQLVKRYGSVPCGPEIVYRDDRGHMQYRRGYTKFLDEISGHDLMKELSRLNDISANRISLTDIERYTLRIYVRRPRYNP